MIESIDDLINKIEELVYEILDNLNRLLEQLIPE